MITRRTVLGAAALAVSGAHASATGAPRTILNDASRLNPTPVSRLSSFAGSTNSEAVSLLRAELRQAKDEGWRVAAHGARHSMGGQSLPRDGLALASTGRVFEIDRDRRIYKVGAGARWRDVISSLDAIGFSPAVMQSNSDFMVGSTFCVNAHGWPVPHGPLGSTVHEVTLMLADGAVVTASRDSEPALFALAMGGYGLFGVVLELVLEMQPNRLLAPELTLTSGKGFAAPFLKAVSDPGVKMAYGRLSVAHNRLLDDGLIVSYRELSHQPDRLPPAESRNALTDLSREIYRAQIDSEFIKRFRWFAETVAAPALSSGVATRNTLMNEPVANLASADRRRTDILHEYFVPPDRFADFVSACRDVIPKARAELLNITLRWVGADETSVLAYAPSPRIAAVMSFSQTADPDGEVDMMMMTERLIDSVLAIGGAFYLPYRLHARRDQMRAAYGSVDRFVAEKRRIDPGLLFRNAMWDTYFAQPI